MNDEGGKQGVAQGGPGDFKNARVGSEVETLGMERVKTEKPRPINR